MEAGLSRLSHGELEFMPVAITGDILADQANRSSKAWRFLRRIREEIVMHLLFSTVGIASAIEADIRHGRAQSVGAYEFLVRVLRLLKFPLNFAHRRIPASKGRNEGCVHSDLTPFFTSMLRQLDGAVGVVLIATHVEDLKCAADLNLSNRGLACLPWNVACCLDSESARSRLYMDAFSDSCRFPPRVEWSKLQEDMTVTVSRLANDLMVRKLKT
jgi:hypothetical protein